MRKKLLAILLMAMLIISTVIIAGCSSKSVDESFISDMGKGLEARWNLVDNHDENTEETQSDYEGYLNAEYDKISEYKDKKFEDKKLGEYAKSYIKLIEESKKSLKYYDNTDKFGAKNDEIYASRSAIIYKLSKDYKLKVSKNYEDDLKNISEDGKTYIAANKIMSKADFKLVEDDYGWKEYAVKIKNTSDEDFSYFNIDINLVDKDGVTVDTESASTDNWDAGSTHKFRFSTDAKFAKIDVKSCDWNY